MKNAILAVVALLALAGCVSHNSSEGERTNFRCDGGKAFSYREVTGGIELYAAGQTHRLAPGSDGAYSDGVVTYNAAGGNASLNGVYGGPYENCRRTGNAWLPRFW